MKLTSATLVSLAFLMSSAVADGTYQATASGTLTLQIAPAKPAEAAAAPQAGETLTVQVVRPAASDDDSKNAEQRDLEACGAKWNAKLKAYREKLAQANGYRTYWETWKDSSAQRPPKLPLPLLTRASYRQCMAQCLQGAGTTCPGGWPDEKLQR